MDDIAIGQLETLTMAGFSATRTNDWKGSAKEMNTDEEGRGERKPKRSSQKRSDS